MLRRFAILCMLLWPVSMPAQETSFTMSGTVVSSTGEPIARALVSINGFQMPAVGASRDQLRSRLIAKTALTDGTGTFRFSGLPSTSYRVTAQKPGFQADFESEGRTPPVELKASLEGVRVVLYPLGVITGTVVDPYDRPMRGVKINALTSSVQDGVRQARSVRTVTTDDRGMYRMWELPKGKYYIKAVGQGGATLLPGGPTLLRTDVGDGFAPVYFGGGATLDGATPVEVGAGSRGVADFRLKLEPAWRINGTLRNLTPNEQVTFSVVYRGEVIAAGPDRFNAATGVFQFKDAVNGSYVLRAIQGDKSGELPVSVADADVAGVSLTLHPSVEIPVHARFTNAPPPVPEAGIVLMSRFPKSCTVTLSAEAMTGATPVELFSQEDSAFQGVGPGRYRVTPVCNGAYIRSVLAGTQDLAVDPVLNVTPDAAPPPIEVLATYGGGTLTGQIEGHPAPESIQLLLVPLFPRPSGPIVTSNNRTDFMFGDIAPGSYTLYAFGRSDIEYRNPAFLKSLTGGLSVQIEDGKKQEVTVKEIIP